MASRVLFGAAVIHVAALVACARPAVRATRPAALRQGERWKPDLSACPWVATRAMVELELAVAPDGAVFAAFARASEGAPVALQACIAQAVAGAAWAAAEEEYQAFFRVHCDRDQRGQRSFRGDDLGDADPLSAASGASPERTLAVAAWATPLERASALLSAGSAERAAELARGLVASAPTDAAAHALLSRALLDAGLDAGEARREAARAAELDPASALAQEALASACLAVRADDCALEAFARARKGRGQAQRARQQAALLAAIQRAARRLDAQEDEASLAARERALEAQAGLAEVAERVPPKSSGDHLVLESGGAALHVDDGGPRDRAAVVFLHGLGGSLDLWPWQLAHARRTRRAVAIDLRGHGQSSAARDGDYSLPSFAADVLAVLRRLGIERCALVGHAFGATVAAAVAAQDPGRIAALLLVDPLGDATRAPPADRQRLAAGPSAEAARKLLDVSWHALLRDGRPGTRLRVLRELYRAEPAMLGSALAGLARHSPADDLARFPGKVVALWTTANDEPFALPALLPALRAERVEGVSHWVMLDAPEVVDRLVDELAPPGAP
jgi:pimeloyl-ACP methyl ester carboxylesterase